MTFLYPFFLWGLLALAIPIIIHLFNFRKAKKIYFSNVKFLDHVKESSSSKLKVKYLLVLFARLLFITFLVFVFAQPFLPGNEKGLDGNAVTIYLDNSQSSSNIMEGNNTGLSTGLDYLNQIIDLYPVSTKFKIITNDFAPTSINYKSKERAREMATELNYSNITRSFDAVMKRLSGSTRDAISSDIYFISDFQKSVFLNNRKSFNDTINRYKIIKLDYQANQNVFVDSIYLENPFLVANNTNRLHVKLKSVGKDDTNDLLVKLFINDRQSATTSLDINKGSSNELIFDLNYKLEGINKCRISFEDFPVTFDNDYYFTLNLLKTIRVVEIGPANSQYFRALFSENELFSYSRFLEGNIKFEQTATADLVIFNQLNSYGNSMKGLIADLKNNGKSVLIIPSEKQAPTELSRIVGFPINTYSVEEKVSLELPDLNNPFFEKTFEGIDRKTILPKAKSVLSWKPTVQDVLRFKNGLPFLSQITSTGKTYLLSAPLEDAYTDLQKHALFVPIMYKMAALSSNSYYPLSYSIDNQLIALNKDTIATNKLYKLSNASQELIPQQQASSDKLVLDIPKYLIQPGYYDLTFDKVLKNTLAFNFTKNESLTAGWNFSEIETLFNGISKVEILQQENVSAFTKNMKDRYEGKNLWKYALILSLIFLFAEVLLLRFL